MSTAPLHGPTFFQHYNQVPAELWRWPDFSPAEIACRGTGKILVVPDALDKLQALRDDLGRPFILNSAYRSPEHNAEVRGAPASKHLEGIAFDVSMANHDPDEFEAAARRHGFKGFGYYVKQGFMHIDARAAAARWGTPFPPRLSRFAPEPVATRPPPALGSAPEVPVYDPVCEAVQRVLAEKGYNEFGATDGKLATKTRGAILAWQGDNGFELTGTPSRELVAAILAGPRRPVAPERAAGKPEDNPALVAVERLKRVGWGGLGLGGLAFLDPIVSALEGGAGLLARVKAALAPFTGILVAYWPLLAVAAGGLVLWFALSGKKSLIADFRAGRLLR